MKFSRFPIITAFVCLLSCLLGSCTTEELPDNREKDYGYVQFRLYKEASYSPESKAVKPELDYLSEASKLKVSMLYNGQTISQTLILSASDKETAEFGLRSDKLKLVKGSYEIVTFTLYNTVDEELYNGVPAEGMKNLTVVAGGLTSHDLTVKVEPRGKVRFTLVKDMSDFTQVPTRSVSRQYTFEEIAYFDVKVQNELSETYTFEELKGTFSMHFDETDDEEDGYRTSSVKCDSLLSLPSGSYNVISYVTYDKNKTLLETIDSNDPAFKKSSFEVSDNRTTDADVKVTLYEADEYMKDNYALYEIWKALDGPNWSYFGETYDIGCNWDFNKDPDLWSYQPGVEVHPNGRVAKIVLSEFGIKGDMPAALGQMTELVELYLGTHNDQNIGQDDPLLDPSQSLHDRNVNRFENNRKYLRMLHPATPMSAPCALALRENGIRTQATSVWDDLSDRELALAAAGRGPKRTGNPEIVPMDVIPGKKHNGLTSLPDEINNLGKLEYLFIGNGELTALPADLSGLASCTDVEIYNCMKMEKFPAQIAQMPKLTQLNISANPQWKADDIKAGLDAIAAGPAGKTLQILYCAQNSLEVFPESIGKMQKLSFLDFASNKIKGTVPALGKNFAPVELYLDNNQIEGFAPGTFCRTDDVETFSMTYNRLTVFPNIFTSDTDYAMGSVDFSYNEIASFPDDFNGIRVETLTLTGNKITVFPKVLLGAGSESQVNYVIFSQNGMTEIPEGCFDGINANQLVSFDFTYNKLKELPDDFSAIKLPYIYGVDLSYNSFSKFPSTPFSAKGMTVYAVRGQRDEKGERCLKEWPNGVYQHTGLRGLYLGSNDIRKAEDEISYLIYNLDISDNPNITFNASSVCYYWQSGAYNLIYDKTQDIVNCDAMLE